MITIKERNGLIINNPDEGEKTLFLDTDGKLKTKNENGLIEEVSIVSANTPKVYKALLNQSGTDAPVATILENTLGGEVVWSHSGDTGIYVGTLVGAFVGNTNLGTLPYATINLITLADGTGTDRWLIIKDSNDTVFVKTFSDSGGTYANGILNNTFINIEVYP